MGEPQIYTIELDGRQYDLQGDHPPTEAEARAAIGSGSAQSAATSAPTPKWYEPGGDVILDNIRKMANPEVVGGIAGLATGGAGTAAAIGIPAFAAAATSAGRDVLNGETSPKGVALDALVHGTLNALPGVAGKALEVAKPTADAALAVLKHLPGMRTAATVAKAAMAAAPAAESAAVPAAAQAAAAPAADEGFLHYLTGTAMVDSTPAQRMILAQQRLYLNEIAKDATAKAAGEAAAKAELVRQAAAKVESAAAAKLAATHAYIVNGIRALFGTGSVMADSTKQEPAR